MDALRLARLDKTAFSVVSLTDESDDKQYWMTKSPYERLRALELMRQIAYGYDPARDRIQRIFEVVQSSSD